MIIINNWVECLRVHIWFYFRMTQFRGTCRKCACARVRVCECARVRFISCLLLFFCNSITRTIYVLSGTFRSLRDTETKTMYELPKVNIYNKRMKYKIEIISRSSADHNIRNSHQNIPNNNTDMYIIIYSIKKMGLVAVHMRMVVYYLVSLV